MQPTNVRRLSLAFALVALAGGVSAQPCETLTKLLGSSPAAGDQFGARVSMSFGGPNNRPLLAIGKPYEDSPAGTDSGGWSVWQLGTNGNWTTLYDAWNATGEAGELGGFSIGISDPYMIVGAPEYQDRGRVRIMRRSTGSSSWLVEDDVNPGLGGGSGGSRFGNSVAISSFGGGWAIIGAPFFSLTHADSGSVSVLWRNSTTGQWLEAFNMSGGSYFGQVGGRRGLSVAMSQTSEWGAFGAPNESHDTAYPENGIAYYISRYSVTPGVLLPPVDEAGQNFGSAVAVEGNWMLVGAADEDASSAESGLAADVTDSGAVYAFERVNGTWFHRATLRAPVPTINGRFGHTIAMSDSQCVINEWFVGRSYVYRRDGATWTLQSMYQNPEPASDRGFGVALAIRDGQVAIGDNYNDPNGIIDAGAVYTATVAPTFVSGDICSEAIPYVSGDFVGCTQTATRSSGNVTTCGLGGSGQGPDVWFRFTPTCDGNAIFDTFGSTFDTVLSVHSDCPTASNNNSIVCNDDSSFAAPNNRASLVTFNFTGGESYLIRVSGYNAASGQFTLRSLVSYGVNNDECSTAPTVGLNSYAFNNCAATNSASVSLPLGNDRDIWYRFIAPTAGDYAFDTCGSSFDTVVTLFRGSQAQCPVIPTQMISQNNNSQGECNPSGVSLQSYATATLTQGQSVMVRVGGANASQFGSGMIRISQIGCDDIDFNNNTVYPEDQDVIDFFTVLSGGPCSAGNTCNDIDFNNNGVFPEDQDVIDFFTVLAGGGCL